jgi:hypothetical protein
MSDMEVTETESALKATETADAAARESIQRVLDQCVERGQLHRLHQWATKLNEIAHGNDKAHEEQE